jgi:hypothetical protein
MNIHRGLARLGLVLSLLMALGTAIVLGLFYFAPGVSIFAGAFIAVVGFITVFGRGKEMFTPSENPATAAHPILAFVLFVLHAVIVALTSVLVPIYWSDIGGYVAGIAVVPLLLVMALEKIALFILNLCSYVADGFRQSYPRK